MVHGTGRTVSLNPRASLLYSPRIPSQGEKWVWKKRGSDPDSVFTEVLRLVGSP